MLRYDVIAGLIQISLHLVQNTDFTIGKSPLHHDRASTLLYGWYDTVGWTSFTNT